MENTLSVQSLKLPEITEKDVLSFLDIHGHTGLKPKQKEQFLKDCIMNSLNPFKREVYIIAFGNQFSIITGYETYIKRAEMSGRLNGWHVETEGSIKGGDLKAKITIHRKDWGQPFIHEVYFSEYNTNQSIWKSKPITMIKKVATSQGMRLCFNEILGGLPYTEAENYEAQTMDVDHEVVNPTINEPIKKEVAKIELLPNTENWNAVFKYISEGGDIEDTKVKYSISEEHEQQMESEVELFLEMQKEPENN